MKGYILESFKEKYGYNTFNEIREKIENEIKSSKYSIIIDDDYILYIFEVCILEECDVEEEKIAKIIMLMGNKYSPPISLSELKRIHKNSIIVIKGYLLDSK